MDIMKKTLFFVAAMFVSATVFANDAVGNDVPEPVSSTAETTVKILNPPSAEAVEAPAVPELEFVVQLHVALGQAYSVGKTTHGTRTIIPITGGTFEGPDIRGEVLPGGADYQMADAITGHIEVEAIYCIRTDDGVTIHIRNSGIINAGEDGMYFTCTPKFEAPADSKYSWLNHKLFICRPEFGGADGGITLNVWAVK